MREQFEISNFTKGQLSKRLRGRTDLDGYFSGAETILNFCVIPQGGATRRPGTLYAANAFSQANPPILRRFIFSETDALVLEFGVGHIAFYANDAPVLSGGAPYTISTPYALGELEQLYFVQSYNTLFITHPNHAPRALARVTNNNWALSTLTLRDGPYQDLNGTTTTLTVSDVSGSITGTFSDTAGVNGGAGLSQDDVGRSIRISLQSSWAWGLITAVASTVACTIKLQPAVGNGALSRLDGAAWLQNTDYAVGQIVSNAGNYYICWSAGTSSGSGTGPHFTPSSTVPYTTGGNGAVGWMYLDGPPRMATPNWRLGKWYAGFWPSLCGFWQQRFVLAGTNGLPGDAIGSVIEDFTNFAPTQLDGTVAPNNAFNFILDDDQNNAPRWLLTAGAAQAAQLGIGTIGGEKIMQAYATAEALTPTNVQVYPETSYGSAPGVVPIRIGKAAILADRPGRKLREWMFQWQVNGYVGPDLTAFCEDITATGIVDLAWQQNPHSILWAVLANGGLIGFTYDRDQQVFAAHQHRLGGDYYGGPPVVEGVEVIPAPDGSYDELWMTVLRTPGGNPRRTVEVMSRWFESDTVAQENGVFTDCSVATPLPMPSHTLSFGSDTALLDQTSDKPPVLIGVNITAAFPYGAMVFVTDSDFFTTAMVGRHIRVNGGLAVIDTYLAPRRVHAKILRGFTSTAPAAQGAWSIAGVFFAAGGLGPLAGQRVSVAGDGFDCGDRHVDADGHVTFTGQAASMVIAGYGYTSAIVTMPFSPKQAAESAQAKAKRIHRIYARFHESVGCRFGRRKVDPMTFVSLDKPEQGEAIPIRTSADPMDYAPPLRSLARRLSPQGGWDEEGQVFILQDRPLPTTVLSLVLAAEVGDMSPKG